MKVKDAIINGVAFGLMVGLGVGMAYHPMFIEAATQGGHRNLWILQAGIVVAAVMSVLTLLLSLKSEAKQ